ncbi:staygreen family protein [Alicyclobacillus fodiniaquatilis]|jgi:hypothetical protein|uniref:Staygreen family protein n=1 Tax=Alicyclobacillus fodiniaquatilis TaxID=1661150 RepID=A0ABW4JBG0_9BACL
MEKRKSPKFRPQKLHTVMLEGVTPDAPVENRHYTLTHSDRTGDLFLSIGLDYNQAQLSGLYTRYMRDEVLAQWLTTETSDGRIFELHAYVHVSGGRVHGRAKSRNQVFIRELPLALITIHYGDQILIKQFPELEKAAVYVHFESEDEKYHRIEPWGTWKDYEFIQPVGMRR